MAIGKKVTKKYSPFSKSSNKEGKGVLAMFYKDKGHGSKQKPNLQNLRKKRKLAKKMRQKNGRA